MLGDDYHESNLTKRQKTITHDIALFFLGHLLHCSLYVTFLLNHFNLPHCFKPLNKHFLYIQSMHCKCKLHNSQKISEPWPGATPKDPEMSPLIGPKYPSSGVSPVSQPLTSMVNCSNYIAYPF